MRQPDPGAVVGNGGYRAGHVGAVVVGINLAGVGHEVIPVDIIDEAVAVVVDAGKAVGLGLVDEHIGGEVLVGVVYTAVDDSDNHLRASGSLLPGVEEVDVGTGTGIGYGAVVVVVPLKGQARVVEGHCGSGHGRSHLLANLHETFATLHTLHGYDFLSLHNAGGALHQGHGLLGSDRFVELDVIPAVEAPFGMALGRSRGRHEHGLHGDRIKLLSRSRERLNTGGELRSFPGHSGLPAYLCGGLRLEFHPDYPSTRKGRFGMHRQSEADACDEQQRQLPDVVL